MTITKLHRLFALCIGFCLMITVFITSIEAVCYWNPGYFEREYTKYQVLNDLPEMTMEDLLTVTDEMMSYLKGNRKDLHVWTTMGNEQREFFTEREIAHMEDVRGLFLAAITIRRICLALIAVLIGSLILSRQKLMQILPQGVFFGSLLFFGAAALIGGIVSTNFSHYFVVFHHIFFNNDLWILDPSVDMLINIVPEPFFMDTALRIILTFGISSLLILGISFLLIKKNKTRKNKNKNE